MEHNAVHEKIFSDQEFPVIARRTLINGPQLIFGGHYHNQFELLYVKRGTLELCCNDVDYVFKAGDIAVLNPYDIHTGYSGSGILFYHCIIVDPLFLEADSGNICMRKYILPFINGELRFYNKMEATPECGAAFEALIREFRRKEPGYELIAKARLLQIFVELYRTVPARPLDKSEWESRKKYVERFQGLFSYMENHFGETIPLDKMASLAGYSPYHFSRQFHLFTGRTPTEYLRSLRMQKAVQLLMEGTSVSETALTCGFNSPNYFCRVFSKEFGYPPRSYQK